MRNNSSGVKNRAFTVSQSIREKDYWLSKLAGDLVKAGFPRDCKSSGGEPSPETVPFTIEGELYSKLIKLGNNSDFRLHMIMVAAVALLLNKYTGIKDIIVGMPVYRQDVEGELNNKILALRIQEDEDMTFKEFLLQTAQTVFEANKNQNYPIELLLYNLDMPDEGKGNEFPLFDTAVLLHNIHDKSYIKPLNINTIFSFSRAKDRITGELEYNSLWYEKETIERIIEHFRHLLNRVLLGIDKPLSRLDIVPGEEKKRILFEFNHTEAEYQKDKTIHSLFEAQSEKTPARTALVYEDIQVSYGELNRRANSFAHMLISKGVGPDIIVAILVKRSIELIISILGVLKAGGAYLPIDPLYPGDRVNFMLADSAVSLAVASGRSGKRIGDGIDILNPEDAGLCNGETDNPEKSVSPHHLAYVIYTSGSTGSPKGVLVPNRGICSLSAYYDHGYLLTREDRVILFASPSFDASVSEMIMALLRGGILFVPGDEIIKDTGKFAAYVSRNHITTATLPPPYAAQLSPQQLPTLRLLLTAGASSTPELADTWRKKVRYINAYGPTESSICTTSWLADREGEDMHHVPIGKPIFNTRVYIVDTYGNVLPIGVSGELWVSGDGIARGYLNRPELTAEKFVISHSSIVNNKLPKMTNDRLYRTGDLARLLPDGNIEFLGRLDHQVKIRGFRIEPEEIETVLQNHEKIKNAVVLAKGIEIDRYLCAYIAGDTRNPLSEDELRDYLSKKLPDYMIPSYFVLLERIPLTANGKVDRKTLSELEIIKSKGEYAAPRNELEETFAKIWQEVLGVEKIGINDNFFRCGGESLKAIQVTAKLHQAGIDVTVRDLFEYQTINGMCTIMPGEKEEAETFESGKPGNRVAEILGCHAYYREYQIRENNSQQGVLYILDGDLSAASVLKKIKKEFKQNYSLNYIKFINSEHEIIEEKQIEEESFSRRMKLKPRLTKQQKQKISTELRKNSRLTALLKKNHPVREYDVSPTQKIWLAAPGEMAQRLIPVSYMITTAEGFQEIEQIILQLVMDNSLLRSIIVKRNSGYMIEEFASFDNIRLPCIDVSGHSLRCHRTVTETIEQELCQPIKVVDHVLFRVSVLKLGIAAYEVIFVFNHIIFDAESKRVLQNQLRRLSTRKDRSPGTKRKDYHHYVSFLNDLTYENVELEKYLDPDNYLRYVDRSYKKFTFTKVQRDSFEIDLAILNDRWKNFYIEIMLLCYADLIRKFFDIEQVPIAAYTNGRNYKNENFNDLIGFFSDMTPILFFSKNNFDPVTKIENLLDYRKYIWENNLHFTNYFLKKGSPAGANLIPPFHFNAVMDFYDYLKTGMHDKMHKTFRNRELSGAVFELLMSRDMHSDNIYIMFSQTSPFENRELIEHFKKDYVEAANYFNSLRQNNIQKKQNYNRKEDVY